MVLRSQRRPGQVNLVFVDNREIRRLNRDYRNRDAVTDVLTFNLDDDTDELLGEVYISLPRAEHNAVAHGHSTGRELLYLFCHGLLHLCGLHHPDDGGLKRVHQFQEKYLARLDREVAQ
jgi:probable rRNA maturation factor